jgi:hypothetical protein
MVPLKEVTCFNPESGTRRLFVTHHVGGAMATPDLSRRSFSATAGTGRLTGGCCGPIAGTASPSTASN